MPQHLVDGVSFNYVEEGDGDPVILVHGVGSRLQSWDGVLRNMGTGRRYVRCDLRGHGGSARVPGPYTLAQMAGDVMALADHLGLESFALVGFSLGGLIAQRIAVDHGERLSALALISTVAGRTPEERERVLARRDTLKADGPLVHLVNSVERWFTPEFIAANPEMIERRRKDAMLNDPDCYLAAYDVLAGCDLVDELGAIRVPSLVMTGEKDIGSSERMARVMHARIAGSELVILPHLKHSILLEAPGLVAGHLERFLTEHAGRAARSIL